MTTEELRNDLADFKMTLLTEMRATCAGLESRMTIALGSQEGRLSALSDEVDKLVANARQTGANVDKLLWVLQGNDALGINGMIKEVAALKEIRAQAMGGAIVAKAMLVLLGALGATGIIKIASVFVQ